MSILDNEDELALNFDLEIKKFLNENYRFESEFSLCHENDGVYVYTRGGVVLRKNIEYYDVKPPKVRAKIGFFVE